MNATQPSPRIISDMDTNLGMWRPYKMLHGGDESIIGVDLNGRYGNHNNHGVEGVRRYTTFCDHVRIFVCSCEMQRFVSRSGFSF
jgi:hypothetical protein